MPEGGEDQEIDWEAIGREEAASEVDDKNAETANEEKDLLGSIPTFQLHEPDTKVLNGQGEVEENSENIDFDYLTDLENLAFNDVNIAHDFESGLETLDSWKDFVSSVSDRGVGVQNGHEEEAVEEQEFNEAVKEAEITIEETVENANRLSQLSPPGTFLNIDDPTKLSGSSRSSRSLSPPSGQDVRESFSRRPSPSPGSRSRNPSISNKPTSRSPSTRNSVVNALETKQIESEAAIEPYVQDIKLEEQEDVNADSVRSPTDHSEEEKLLREETIELEKTLSSFELLQDQEKALLNELNDEKQQAAFRLSLHNISMSHAELDSAQSNKIDEILPEPAHVEGDAQKKQIKPKNLTKTKSAKASMAKANKSPISKGSDQTRPNDETFEFGTTSTLDEKPTIARELTEKDASFASLTEDEKIAHETAWKEYLEVVRDYTAQQRNLEIEYSVLSEMIENEKKKQSEHTFLFDQLKISKTAHNRGVRVLKSKKRDLQGKVKSILAWFKVDAKNAFEREKDKGLALLQKAASLMEEQIHEQADAQRRIESLKAVKEDIVYSKSLDLTEVSEIEKSIKTIMAEIKFLNKRNENEIFDVGQKRAYHEKLLQIRKQQEENKRAFENNMLKEACVAQNVSDFKELEAFNLEGKQLSELPEFKETPNIRYMNIDKNLISNLEGLNVLQNLSYLSSNYNSVIKVETSAFTNLKYFAATNNNISNVAGFAACANLQWIELSDNPIRNLEFLKECPAVKVLILRNIRATNYSIIGTLKSLLVLDLGCNHIYNEKFTWLSQLPVLNYLAVDNNLYTELFQLSNLLMYELQLQNNRIRKFEFNHFLPTLRNLNLSSNGLYKMGSLALCPNIVELYLQDNRINDMSSIFSISMCSKLKILDLRGNPLTFKNDFRYLVHTVFPNLRTLNGDQNLDIWKRTLQGLKVSHIYKACIQYLESLRIHPDRHRDVLSKEYDEYKRSHKSFRRIIKSFFGPPFSPFLQYLTNGAIEDSLPESSKMELQERNLSWLYFTSSKYSKDIMPILSITPPIPDIFILPTIIRLEFAYELECIIFIQSWYKKRIARREFKQTLLSINKLQTWWKAVFIERQESKRIAEMQLRLRACQKIIRCFRSWSARRAKALAEWKAKKLEEERTAVRLKLLAEAEALEKENELNKWIEKTADENFGENLETYLSNDTMYLNQHPLPEAKPDLELQKLDNPETPIPQERDTQSENTIPTSRPSSKENENEQKLDSKSDDADESILIPQNTEMDTGADLVDTCDQETSEDFSLSENTTGAEAVAHKMPKKKIAIVSRYAVLPAVKTKKKKKNQKNQKKQKKFEINRSEFILPKLIGKQPEILEELDEEDEQEIEMQLKDDTKEMSEKYKEHSATRSTLSSAKKTDVSRSNPLSAESTKHRRGPNADFFEQWDASNLESFFAEKNAKRALDDEKRKYKINGNADRWDEYYQPDPHADEDVQLSSDRQSLDEKNDESQMITKDTRFIWDFENKEKYTRKKCEMSKLTAEVEKKQISHKQYPRPPGVSPHVTLLINNYVASKLIGGDINRQKEKPPKIYELHRLEEKKKTDISFRLPKI